MGKDFSVQLIDADIFGFFPQFSMISDEDELDVPIEFRILPENYRWKCVEFKYPEPWIEPSKPRPKTKPSKDLDWSDGSTKKRRKVKRKKPKEGLNVITSLERTEAPEESIYVGVEARDVEIYWRAGKRRYRCPWTGTERVWSDETWVRMRRPAKMAVASPKT